MTEERIAELRQIPASGPFTSGEPAIMGAALQRALDERETLLAALKKIQWSGHSGYGHGDPGFNLCPECKGAAPDSGWPSAGRHEVDCRVGAAIKKAEAP